ncbi:cobalamin biosynthesis protein [Symbioplanes lichenis]|uniref:cobalamin biosynthesis protein n=1 Tax=Symbioplanes lichenis TaxID=1629072 RepID=UPI002739BE73|nr:cobalamin biosynthesis protein [Actinoplanes lichenis]
MTLARAGGIAVGIFLDHLLEEPARFHPVAGFGRIATRVERSTYGDSRARGVLHTAVLLVPLAAAGVLTERLSRRHPLAEVVAVGLTTWIVLCGSATRSITREISEPLVRGDVAGSRELFPKLFYRSSDVLTDEELPTVLIFGVTESLCDAEVAPLLWAAAAGIPGLLLYRAINVLDNKIGYRSTRYRRFGWAAARLDDVANLLPARLAAGLTALCAGTAGGSSGAALRVWWRDAGRDSSPNSGQLFGSFAGAFRLRLTKPAVGLKPGTSAVTFGAGVRPGPEHLLPVIRLSGVVGGVAGALAVAASALRGRRTR